MVVARIENTTRDTDFDQALDQALAIDLEQSPYLNLISRPAIQQTLTEMQQSPQEALTASLAREVCERNNAQVVLGGTLSRLGSRYLLMLHADSCVNGKEVAGVKAQAGSKEAVLGALDSAAGQLRRKLGESTASLGRFQIPVAQATRVSAKCMTPPSPGAAPPRRCPWNTIRAPSLNDCSATAGAPTRKPGWRV